MRNISLEIGHTPNYATVTVGPITLHYSYQTVIAFNTGNGLVVRENDWGPTTGKHLNRVDGGGKAAKARRIPGETFEAQLEGIVSRIEVTA